MCEGIYRLFYVLLAICFNFFKSVMVNGSSLLFLISVGFWFFVTQLLSLDSLYFNLLILAAPCHPVSYQAFVCE